MDATDWTLIATACFFFFRPAHWPPRFGVIGFAEICKEESMAEKVDDRQLAAQIVSAFIGRANIDVLLKQDAPIPLEKLWERVLKMVSQKQS